MNTNRREFLQQTVRLGLGASVAGMIAGESVAGAATPPASGSRFNMTGYAAPRLDLVRIGIIGLGNRGTMAVKRLANLEGIAIVGICDLREECVRRALTVLNGTKHRPDTYAGTVDGWRRLCDRGDVDVIYICTPWLLHTPMAVQAMKSGKHAFVEVPAARTLEECWELVETSERTRRYCRMLENCCYDEFELVTLQMARAGFFGEIVHCEGAYLHTNVFRENFDKNYYWNMWRLRENTRHGNLYPTHGLGPVCQIMGINRGDRMDFMVSMSSADFEMEKRAEELAAHDPFFVPFEHKSYRGNINTSIISTTAGRTIMVQHDVTSPRPYSRIHLVSGTKAMARKYPLPARIARGDEWLADADFKAVTEQYTPDLLRRLRSDISGLVGHGGADVVMDWRWIYCLRQGIPLDHDVYDAALWSSIAPLSEQSVAAGSSPVKVPDFTGGNWRSNAPVTMAL